ncbi:MAG TPA: hypothetical protein VN867_04520 [Candidatus Binataceae bacterium]|nr:hypothetical protein [Candidatus Binataceae bacterium]
MSEMNETNGTDRSNGANAIDISHGISAATGQKRFSTRKLEARIADLERKIGLMAAQSTGASGELPQQIADLAEQMAKLDDRVSKIAHAVAQLNLVR